MANTTFIDMMNKKYGKLTVLSRADNRITTSGRTEVMWLCSCECGITKPIPGKSLRNGSCRSCGCGEYVRELRFTPDERLYNLKRYEASRRNLEFTLTLKEFLQIVKSNCTYCGEPPSHKHHMKRRNDNATETVIYNGVDRTVNEVGYVSGNCVPCCWTCNAMKLKLSLVEFKEKITTIYNRICLNPPAPHSLHDHSHTFCNAVVVP